MYLQLLHPLLGSGSYGACIFVDFVHCLWMSGWDVYI